MNSLDEESQYLAESFRTVYEIFHLMGIDPSRWKMNYQFDVDEDDIVSMALPDAKIAVVTDEDDDDTADRLGDEGWTTFRLPSSDVIRLHGIMSGIREIVRADTLRRMSVTDKTTSSHETTLLKEILRRRLPEPDRNYKFIKASGKELTTPDFTWPEHRVAFFMDGLWWHVSKDDKQRLEVLRAEENERDLMELNRTRQQKDGENRSVLSSRGWLVLSCTDVDLETGDGVRRVGQLIEDTLNNVEKQQKAAAKASDFEVKIPLQKAPASTTENLAVETEITAPKTGGLLNDLGGDLF